MLKELSQYRIIQQAIDGKNTFSEIRIVKGYGQSAGLQVFPNPTADGSVTVVLENAGAETILQLVDMNGRTVRTWDHITGNRIFVDGIHSGMYILRAWPAGTHESVSVKLVVGR
jgi:alpha-acetolactate decarboxylase